MCSGIHPDENAAQLSEHIDKAAAGGATMLFTPEMTGLLDRDRTRAATAIRSEADDVVLSKARLGAKQAGIWIQLGSLAIQTSESVAEKWVNRSYLINPDGKITAR